eukprot:TRINITY_DN106723_c0_g1_i1.p1 TRINITY_DN106723_c0_g1~~TRINITY_DN106723_c0_g1_i1.p1  ORF type:complete len:161 (-),score=26.19 TRINITY_DN106723_c0_g1_i1:794-1276(-)
MSEGCLVAELESLEVQLEKSLSVCSDASGPRIVLATHVDDLVVAWWLAQREAVANIEFTKACLKDTRRGAQATCYGKLVQCFEDRLKIDSSLLNQKLSMTWRQQISDSKLTTPEFTSHRSTWGQLPWLALQNRPDAAVETNLVAQRAERVTIGDFCIRLS